LRSMIELYEQEITLHNTENLNANKKALLKEFVDSLKLSGLEELVMASRLIDYIDESLLIRRDTYSKLSKEQLTRQIRSKFVNN
jgi:hypothetical protein